MPKGKGIRLARGLLRAAISIVLMWLLLRHANLHRVADTIKDTHLGWFFLAMLIKGSGILAGVTRWWLMLRAQQIQFRLTHLGGAYLVGRFFGSFLPSTIGLDAYRTYWAAIRSRQVARTVAVTVVEKIIGLLALSLLCLAVLPFGQRMLQERTTVLMAVIISLPILVSVLLLVRPGWFGRLSERWGRRGTRLTVALARMSDAVARFGRQPGTMLAAVGLGLLVHGGTSAMYLATARAVGAQVSGLEVLFVGPLMIAATLVPVSIAGIGVREGTFVFFLSTVGVPADQAVLLGFLGYLAGEIYSLMGGVIWLLMPAVRPQDEHSLVDVVSRAAAWMSRQGSEKREATKNEVAR